MVKSLLQNRVSVNEKSFLKEWTPLQHAIAAGDHDIVRNLLKYGADIHSRDKNGKTSLDIAKEKGQFAIFETLQAWEKILDEYGDIPRTQGARESIAKILGPLNQDGMDANLIHDDEDKENLYQLTEINREMEFLARAEFREENRMQAQMSNRLFGLSPKSPAHQAQMSNKLVGLSPKSPTHQARRYHNP